MVLDHSKEKRKYVFVPVSFIQGPEPKNVTDQSCWSLRNKKDPASNDWNDRVGSHSQGML